MEIAIDFDGTIVEHAYPAIGAPVPNALHTMKRLKEAGHKIFIWTMRSGSELKEAVDYVQSNGIMLDGINNNPEQYRWTRSPKCYAHLYVDDASLGCPLVEFENKRPYVDWHAVESWMEARKII